jgi:hypothetical protein
MYVINDQFYGTYLSIVVHNMNANCQTKLELLSKIIRCHLDLCSFN